jgi:hypothetical protein
MYVTTVIIICDSEEEIKDLVTGARSCGGGLRGDVGGPWPKLGGIHLMQRHN